jgi:hypothetical protein
MVLQPQGMPQRLPPEGPLLQRAPKHQQQQSIMHSVQAMKQKRMQQSGRMWSVPARLLQSHQPRQRKCGAQRHERHQECSTSVLTWASGTSGA